MQRSRSGLAWPGQTPVRVGGREALACLLSADVGSVRPPVFLLPEKKEKKRKEKNMASGEGWFPSTVKPV